MAQDEHRVVGDDGELLKPDTTNLYDEAVEQPISPPQRRARRRADIRLIVLLLLGLVIIYGVWSVNNVISPQATPSYHEILPGIYVDSDYSTSVYPRLSQTAAAISTSLSFTDIPTQSIEQQQLNVTRMAVMRGLYLTQTQEALIPSTPRPTNTPPVTSTESENVSATFAPTP
jgi:hypothetical protein